MICQEPPEDHWQSHGEWTDFCHPALMCPPGRRDKLKPMCLRPVWHNSPIPWDWYLLLCRITVPSTLEGLKKIQAPSRIYSKSSWVPVKQSTLYEANTITNKALDLAAHQLHIFVGFCCVGSTRSKLVMSLSSSHVILCGFLSCNKYCNPRYIDILWSIALLTHEY